ncbi:plasmid pRiA4b ORF-3 family protein [Candidatus Poribacteria bacterium]|nr:plasmid pRiA4b ORF-3 family protein [Candidatus Poribacteria bacterium]
MPAANKPILQLHVSLEELDPLIWRRILIEDTATLADLHNAIQAAFGWGDCHLHEFQFGKRSFQDLSVWDSDASESEDTDSVKLAGLFSRKKSGGSYTYDFGDCWVHKIVLEDRLERGPKQKYPQCTGGEYACPPEDCGGAYSYPEFVEAITDPENPDHEELREWVGPEFDPLEFDLKAANKRVQHSRR